MKKKEITKKTLRDFSLVFGIGLPLIIGFLLPMVMGHVLRFWTIFVGIIFIILGILRPYLLFYPYKFWMFFGDCLGWVNSRIILGLVFVIVLQPIALIMKLFGYDPLKTRKSSSKSFREEKKENKIDMTKIF